MQTTAAENGGRRRLGAVFTGAGQRGDRVIEVTRMAAGASEESGFEIYGSQGALIYRKALQTPCGITTYGGRNGSAARAESLRRQANDPSTRSGPTPIFKG